nr:hypothetical transcript [Hymenolepis microstoma]
MNSVKNAASECLFTNSIHPKERLNSFQFENLILVNRSKGLVKRSGEKKRFVLQVPKYKVHFLTLKSSLECSVLIC